MEVVLAVVVVFGVVWFVTGPLRRARATPDAGEEVDARLAELEARKEAKYREIRDAQLDHAQGKLSEPDFRRVDADLRREAVDILKELDRVRGTT
jgi:hypothetical protein